MLYEFKEYMSTLFINNIKKKYNKFIVKLN